jgi:hypothetical protein
VIRFPDTDRLVERAGRLRVPVPVVVRDLARIVEILNLREQGFFGARSVLAGGMAMRTFGSQRLTIYDADLSARAVVAPTQLTLPLEDGDRRFKVDMAGYGVLEDGEERVLTDPYGLALWEGEAPSVTVMRLEEIAAEKTLGWCAHRLYKHLADLAFIADKLADSIDRQLLRELVDGKLGTMRDLQPRNYEHLPTLDDVIEILENAGPIPTTQRLAVTFLHNPYTAGQVVKLVRESYAPLLKRYP